MAEGLIIVTKDEDFAQRKALGQTGPAVIWGRLPNARRHVLLDAFAAALPELISELTRGETLIELV